MVAKTVTNNVEQLPFEHQWNYYLDNGSWAEKPEDYLTVMTKLCTVATIQQFWQYMNGMQQSMLKILDQASPVFSLRMFRSDVKPIWEDKHNTHGGKWIIPLATTTPESFWKMWEELTMCVVGESFCRKSSVCGVVLSGRPGRKNIEVWTDSTPTDIETEKQFLQKLLGTASLWFKAHDTTLARVDVRAAVEPCAAVLRLIKIDEDPSAAATATTWSRASRTSSVSSTSSTSSAPVCLSPQSFSLSPQTSAKTSPSSSSKTSPSISPLSAHRTISLKPQTKHFSVRVIH